MTDAPVDFATIFELPCDVVECRPLAGGHIHTSLLVVCADARFVAQRINRRIFADVDGLVANYRRVASHLRAKGAVVAAIVPTRSGDWWYEAADNSAWRVFEFLEGTEARATAVDPRAACEAARAFGAFAAALDDLPAPPLVETIPRFHDLSQRVVALDAAVARDALGRRRVVAAVIDDARALARWVNDALAPLLPWLPLRVVHNDAKIANVRFSFATGEAVAVVDLDTVMPGTVLHDVGELVRTATTHAPEDSAEPGAVDFDLDLLDSVARGYASGIGKRLTVQEVDALAFAGPWLAVENGVRFLTDHLDGDQYFGVDRRDQNLDRARTQLRLTQLMLERLEPVAAAFNRAARR